MNLVYSQRPGRLERHLMRKHNNPLFPHEAGAITASMREEAQRLDHEELVEFINGFRNLVLETAALKPNEESDTILRLKERLDSSYEQACRLADDQSETKSAIRKLLEVIMQSVQRGAEGDAHALAELEQEQVARDAHFALLEFPLVVDILDPESPIKEQELLPSLLSAPSDQEFLTTLELFDSDQRSMLQQQAQALMKQQTELSELQRARIDRLIQGNP